MSLDNDNLEKKALFTCPGTNGNDQEGTLFSKLYFVVCREKFG